MTFELTAQRDALLEAVATASRAVSRSVPQQALRLRLSGGRLKATGTDRDLTISAEVAVDGPGEGTVVAPARLLTDIVRSLEGTVSLRAEDEGLLAVEAGRARFTLRTYSPNDFPPISGPEGPVVALPVAGLAEALGQVVRAASTEGSRPVLQGVLVEATEGGLRLVATDSYRLAVRDVAGMAGLLAEGQSVLVPARALAEAQRLLSDGPDAVDICMGRDDVRFDLGGVRLTARLVEGEFPPYRQIVPNPGDLPNRLVVGREALLGALRRVKLLAPDQSTPAKLALSAGGVKVSLAAAELGEAAEELEAKYEGEDMVVAFNPSYLADGVEAAPGDEVSLDLAEPMKPALLRPVEGGAFSYVVMPVRVV